MAGHQMVTILVRLRLEVLDFFFTLVVLFLDFDWKVENANMVVDIC